MADQAKLDGDQAFKERRFDEAVKSYTAALEQNAINGTNPKHTLLSNRSASYCQLKQYDKALEDALACVSCQPSFAKGWSRKAAALHGKGDFSGALQAYKKVLSLDPSNEAAKQEIASLEARATSSTFTGSAGNRTYSSSSSSRDSARNTASEGRAPKWLNAMLLLAQIYSLVNSVSVIFLTDFYESRHAFGRAILASLLSFVGQAVVRHGVPSLKTASTLWKAFRGKAEQSEVKNIANFAMDNNTHNIFYCTLTMSASPSLLLLIPLVLENVLSVSRLIQNFSSSIPALSQFLVGATDKVLSRETDVRRMACNAEVLIFFALIFELLTPRRNLLLLVLYAQLLRVRYIVHADSRAAWAAVGQRADGVLLHARSPSFVQAAYRKIKSMAGGLVTQTAPS